MAHEKKKRNNPKSFVEGLRQVVQDLLVPELRAIQVTLQHHGELIQGLQRQMETMQRQNDERFASMQKQMDERFTAMQQQILDSHQQTAEEFKRVWQAITELLEGQRHTQLVLQRILDRLDVTEMVKETQTRQRVVEAQTEQLREEVAHLRRLLEMAMGQKGIQPITP
ncbi:MAG: hypothetical protein NZ805_06920 [Armatimonadetes bacterium]|nr:hypothetical protein [Armatimonadota bacterium]MDW8027521.1 hypothetical protein [Armatimonadota bacterium]